MTKPILLDRTDEEIIRQFQMNGRSSNRAVGEAVGLSEGAVRKRLKRLTESGHASYGLIVDIQATGMAISGFLSVQVAPSALAAVSRQVADMETCALCMLTTGNANIRAYIYEKDALSLANTTARIAAMNGVSKVEFREAMYFTQHRYELLMMPDGYPSSEWTL